MDLHASQIQGFFNVPVDKCVPAADQRTPLLTSSTRNLPRFSTSAR